MDNANIGFDGRFFYHPHDRQTIRLRGFDYSKSGKYFITICVHDRTQLLFGDVVDGTMVLSAAGFVVRDCWRDIPNHFPDVRLDEFAIMPNHIHGILSIQKTGNGSMAGGHVGAQNFEPLQYDGHRMSSCNRYQHIIPRSLGSIVRGFKTGATKIFRERFHLKKNWQRNYYEHIIRDAESTDRIRQYIRDNPIRWHENNDKHLSEEIDRFYGQNDDIQ